MSLVTTVHSTLARSYRHHPVCSVPAPHGQPTLQRKDPRTFFYLFAIFAAPEPWRGLVQLTTRFPNYVLSLIAMVSNKTA